MSVLSPTANRSAWLAERRRGLGASDAAAAVGLCPYRSPLDLYLEKLGIGPEVEETEAMRWGTRLEPLIARAYTERTGNAIADEQRFIRSDADPHLSATIDAVDEHGTLCEWKCVGGYAARDLGDEETDQVPAHWIVQAHQQMHVAGDREIVVFGVLVGGQQFRLYDVSWNERLWSAIKPKLDDFWQRVQDRNPPPVSQPSDHRAVARLFGECVGKAWVGPEVASKAEQWDDLGRQIRELEERRDTLKAELLLDLGNVQEAVLPDGRKLRRSLVVLPERTVQMKGSTSVRLSLSKRKD